MVKKYGPIPFLFFFLISLLISASSLDAELQGQEPAADNSTGMHDRNAIVLNLYDAMRKGDFREASRMNSLLSQEAFQRSYKALKAWESTKNTSVGLVPRGLTAKMAYWNAKDNASDLFCHLLIAGRYLESEEGRLIWMNMLQREREICGAMPCRINFNPRKVVKEDPEKRIFGASEYAKDGLSSIAEHFGPGPWFTRLEEIVQQIIRASSVKTETGTIPALDTEVNGNMLQVLPRLYWATKNSAYLEMAERIADVYLFDILPKSRYLPSKYWDLSTGTPLGESFRFLDHGNELVPGLVELYLFEKIQNRPRAARYREPLKKFLDTLLATGRSKDGLWHGSVDRKSRQTIDGGTADTWGYILNAYKIFDIAETSSLYEKEIIRFMQSVAARHPLFDKTQKISHDDYADSIESMLYLLPWYDIPECHRWTDNETGILFGMQLPSGFISEGYLDGNFIRTALLYAFYKTQGTMMYPWREDLALGAFHDKTKNELYLYLEAQSPWSGLLKFDIPRHSAFWNMPVNYPRLNSLPEWFVVDPLKEYAVFDLATGRKNLLRGGALAKGLPVFLEENKTSICLRISPQ